MKSLFWKATIIFLIINCFSTSFGQITSTNSGWNDFNITILSKNDSLELKGAVIIQKEPETKNARYYFSGTNGIVKIKFIPNSTIDINYTGFYSFSFIMIDTFIKNIYLEPKINDLQNVIITAQSNPTPSSGSLYDVQSISSQTLKEKGANNLREALQTELNIDLSNDQVFGSTLSINGVSGEGVRIMIDGTPVVGRVDGKLDLSQITLTNIEKIEIVKGPLGVQYGSDAIGGVINIITKSNSRNQWQIGAKGYYESVGQYNIELNGSYNIKNTNLFLNAGRNFFDGYTAKDTFKRFDEWKPREQYFAEAKIKSNGSKWNQIFSLSFFRELMLNRSEPRLGINFSDDTSWTYKGDDIHFLTYRIRASQAFNYTFNTVDKWENLISYSGFFRNISRYEKDLVSGNEVLSKDVSGSDSTLLHHVNMRSIYHTRLLRNMISLQAGVDFNLEFSKQKRIANGAKNAQEYATFLTILYQPVKWMGIQGAFRTGYNVRINRGFLIPSANIRIEPHPKVLLRFGYGRGYRTPSLKELYLQFFDINHSIKGNPNLLPEKSNSFTLNTQFKVLEKKVGLNIFGNFFLNQVFDKIDYLIIPGKGPELDTLQYTNLKNYMVYGPSAGIQFKWKNVSINSEIQYSWFEVSADGNTVKHQSPDVTVSGKFLIPYIFCNFAAVYKYNGPKLLYTINSSIQSGIREGFHTLDVSLSKNFWKDKIELTLGGKNLLNVQNVNATGLSATGHNYSGNQVNANWGASFFCSLAVTFSKSKKSNNESN